jgi:hypothetical protein
MIRLEEAKARFEEWRQTRKGRAAISDELWSTAAELAQKEGLSRTATELRLELSELKRRVTATAEVSRPKAPVDRSPSDSRKFRGECSFKIRFSAARYSFYSRSS